MRAHECGRNQPGGALRVGLLALLLGTALVGPVLADITPSAAAPGDVADLVIGKQDSPDPVIPGQTLTYTISVDNLGPATATGVVVVDPLPSGVTAGALPAGCSAAGQTVTCQLPDITPFPSPPPSVQIPVTVNPAQRGTLTNTATASSVETDPNTANNTISEPTSLGPRADVALTKIDAPDPVAPGQNLVYTLSATNNGPSTATNVVVTDPLPAGVTFVSATPACTGSTTLSCALGTIAPGASVPLAITGTVATTVTSGTMLTNTATVTRTEPDPNPANDTATATTRVDGTVRADLAITKTDSPDPVVAGRQLAYTLTVTNNGPSNAPAVAVTDNLPASVVTFVSATPTTGTCTQAALVVSCNLGALTAGQARTITILVNVNSNPGTVTTLTNTASASGGTTPDPNTANNSATATTAIIRSADLSVTKVDSPDPVAPGQNITYTVTASNAGPSAQGPVTLTDTLPPGVTFVSVNSDFGSCSQAAGTVTCGLGTVVTGRVATITIVVGIPASFGNQTITNSATIAPGGTGDPVPGNNTASASTTVTRQADLQITKTDAPDPVIAGQQLTYTLTGRNNGPSNASAVTISDPLPAGTTFVSASAGCTNGAGVVTCTIGDLALNATATRTITVAVAASTAEGATLSNTATISAAAADPTPGNNSATATTTVARSADLSITKTDSPDPVLAGTTVTYSLNITNAGPSDAAAVTVTDPLPAGTAFISGTAGCAIAGTTVTCTLGPVAAGTSIPVTLVVSVLPSVAAGTTLTNTATVGSTTTDPTSGNNRVTATTDVTRRADVAITKADAPDPATAGSQLTYTLNVSNLGPSDAAGVTITDPLPTSTLFVSASPGCTESSGAVTCTIATLAAATSAPFTIVVGVLPNVADGTVLTNTATATTSTPDSTPANNAATATTTVNASADLSITKTDAPDPANAGGSVTFTLTVTNNGPSNASGITVTDTLPAGITVAPAPAGCTLSAPTLTCTIASLAPSSSATINYTVGIAPQTRGVLTNTATVSATTPDPNPADNSATSTTTVDAPADVSITKTDNPDPVVAGMQLTYTLTAGNDGPARANNVVITDLLPVATTFVGASTGCTNAAGTISCAIGVLDPAGTATVTVTVAVPAATPAGTTITNTATIAATETDPIPGNNSASATTTVTTSADLALTKTDAPDPVNAGGPLTYTLAVTNNGPSDAASVVITDPLPVGTTFASAAPGCTDASGTVTCTIGTIASGATTMRTIAVIVLPTVLEGTVLTDTAAVSAATPDPAPANNTAAAATTVSTSADLAILKTDAPDPVLAGTQLTYTITVTNVGPSDASDVVVSDTLPSDTTFASGSSACSDGAGTVTCAVGPLANGSGASLTITVLVAPSTTSATISNTATVASGSFDPNLTNNTATVVTSVARSADLAIAKTVAPDPIVPGTNAVYTIVVTNLGPSDSIALVTDSLPSSLAFVSADGAACVDSGATVTCDLETIGSGSMIAFTITAAVNPAASGPIVNTATVAGNATDPDPANDSVTISTLTAPVVDLEITKTATTTHYVPGGPLSFEITVVNHGPSTASDARVTDPLPPTLTDASWSCDANCAPSSGTGSVDTAVTLAPGARSVITVTATVALGTTGVVTNVASVEGGGSTQVAGAEVMPGRSISGHVYDDRNRNDRLDPGEPDLAGVVVRLTGAGPDGVLGSGDDVALGSVTTSSPYVFENLTAGAYRVTVDTATVPAGLTATGDFDGGADSRADVVLTSDQSVAGVDFGYADAPALGSGGSSLPFTGGQFGMSIAVAAGAILAGAPTFLLRRRRRAATR